MEMTTRPLLFLNLFVCRWPVKSAEFLLHMLKVNIEKDISSFSMYYLKTLDYIFNSSQNAESNAEYKGLDADHLIIEHIQVHHWNTSITIHISNS